MMCAFFVLFFLFVKVFNYCMIVGVLCVKPFMSLCFSLCVYALFWVIHFIFVESFSSFFFWSFTYLNVCVSVCWVRFFWLLLLLVLASVLIHELTARRAHTPVVAMLCQWSSFKLQRKFSSTCAGSQHWIHHFLSQNCNVFHFFATFQRNCFFCPLKYFINSIVREYKLKTEHSSTVSS